MYLKGPNVLPVPINEVSTSEDQFRSLIDNKAAEQSSDEKNNNVKDNTSMTIIDPTIDDSSEDRDLQRMKAKHTAKNKNTEHFKKKIAKKKEIVINIKKALPEIQRNRLLQLVFKF